MGLAGLAGRAQARVGRSELGRAFGLGPGRKGEVFVFLNFLKPFPMQKQLQ
jgi:hypothetical protein